MKGRAIEVAGFTLSPGKSSNLLSVWLIFLYMYFYLMQSVQNEVRFC